MRERSLLLNYHLEMLRHKRHKQIRILRSIINTGNRKLLLMVGLNFKEIAELFSSGKFSEVENYLSDDIVWNIYEEKKDHLRQAAGN